MQSGFFSNEKHGRFVLIGSAILIWLLILTLFKVYGYENTWGLWKIPVEMPPFVDFRLIPGSAESFQRGFEPTIENPDDPRGRIFNYPAFWRIFFYSGITQDDTVWISALMILLFFVGVFLFPDKLRISDALAMLFVTFSPAAMLLYERGNVDLFVFFLCVLIVLAGDYSAILTAMLLMAGAVIKLFPFFGISILLRESKSRFLWLFGGCFLLLLVYMYVTFDSVRASWNLTMRGDGLSYGTNILITRYGDSISRILAGRFSDSVIQTTLKYGPLVLALLLLFVVFIFAIRNLPAPITLSVRNIAAFRMGASIYIGTFLLGNNWDYRLTFLVLVVPQLMQWLSSGDKKYRIIAGAGIGFVFISCWFLVSSFYLNRMYESAKIWIVSDEVINWMLFIDLAYLIFASAPGWVKELFRFLLPKKDPVPVV